MRACKSNLFPISDQFSIDSKDLSVGWRSSAFIAFLSIVGMKGRSVETEDKWVFDYPWWMVFFVKMKGIGGKMEPWMEGGYPFRCHS
ncbi:hypothetical protein CEXT_325321 [Caerostris extrusa]|uniref:Uncharacterized protein n=1 Tax=Caerostris extrusa TaxID=172846 RepID=A0AAV4MAA6_CAEEX|nr:hypothetical protein CEXT_325321 [Caerostris extrusa]